MSEPTIEKYLEVCHQFRLGTLPTECSNPLTVQLSQLCGNPETLGDGLRALQDADLFALSSLIEGENGERVARQIEQLAAEVHTTFANGKKVVCEGCGATGRLSLSLEVFAREGMVLEPEYQDKVIGFMAGGDAALIRSIEQFEDRVEFGKRQLHAVNFEDGDLLLAITEGGETPFVIAACEEAVVVSSSRKHWFLYCNPDHVLREVAERSQRVLDNEKIEKMNLYCGNMAITGSTRMQATTVQVLAAGLAIQHHAHPERIRPALKALLAATRAAQYRELEPFTANEAKMYQNNEYFLYETKYFSVTVMTDTTERAPTFSMPPFESFHPESKDLSSPVYMVLPDCSGAKEGWERLMRRPLRPLEWPETFQRTGEHAILGYDFSDQVAEKRAARIGAEKTTLRAIVSYEPEKNGILFSLPHAAVNVLITTDPAVAQDKLLVNVFAKMLLNAHSTAVMGVLQRYEGNVMTWVRPSNNKLIDRAARYVRLLLSRRLLAAGRPELVPADGADPVAPFPSYAEICTRIYELRDTASTNTPLVLVAVEEYMKKLA